MNVSISAQLVGEYCSVTTSGSAKPTQLDTVVVCLFIHFPNREHSVLAVLYRYECNQPCTHTCFLHSESHSMYTTCIVTTLLSMISCWIAYKPRSTSASFILYNEDIQLQATHQIDFKIFTDLHRFGLRRLNVPDRVGTQTYL